MSAVHLATVPDRPRPDPRLLCDGAALPDRCQRTRGPEATHGPSWLYRAGLEAILGFRLQGTTFTVDPCLRPDWPGYELVYHLGSLQGRTRYELTAENPDRASWGVVLTELDGVTLADGPAAIRRVDDGAVHRVRVVLG